MLRLCLFISLIATCGSLYFSEILGFTPCNLCWYQRIFMYPLIFLIIISMI
ncbi:disulfide bond formation protein B, partial [Bacillus cereus group sp. TH40LC]